MESPRVRIETLVLAVLAWTLAGVALVGRGPVRAANADGALVLSFSERPSHHGLYRAELLPSPSPVARNRDLAWTIVLETADGRTVGDAALDVQGWMPQDEWVMVARPRATEYLGDGRYRIEGIRFDRPGWWNLCLQISGPTGTDSLAFNLIL